MKKLLLLCFIFLFVSSAHAIRITPPGGAGGAGAVTSVNGQVGAVVLKVPEWEDFTVVFGDFTAAAAQEDISLFTLLAGDVIHGIEVKHSASFTGGPLTGYSVSIGIAGDLDKYGTDFNVFQAAGASVLQNSEVLDTPNKSATTDIRIRATAVGGFVNDALAGSLVVRVLKGAP